MKAKLNEEKKITSGQYLRMTLYHYKDILPNQTILGSPTLAKSLPRKSSTFVLIVLINLHFGLCFGFYQQYIVIDPYF